jgi:hypothetical protein
MTDWLTDQPTDRPAYRLADRPIDWPTDRPTDWLTDWLTDWATDRPTDQLIPWKKSILYKLICYHLINIFCAYWTRKFSTLFTTHHHLTIFWARFVECTPSRSILEDPINFYPPIYIQVSFLQASPPNTVCTSPLLLYIRAICPVHLILDWVSRITLVRRSWSFTLCNFLKPPVS